MTTLAQPLSLTAVNELSNHDAALRYVDLGWFVVPLWWVRFDEQLDQYVCACPKSGTKDCSPGKHPWNGSGLKGSTNTTFMVERWWRQEPRLGVAVDMKRSGLVALDRDGWKDAPDAQSWGFNLDDAAVQLSGSRNGEHYVWRTNQIGDLIPSSGIQGVDTKYDGYIVVAPTLHKSGGRYSWVSDQLPGALPSPLLDRLLERKSTRSIETGGDDKIDRDAIMRGQWDGEYDTHRNALLGLAASHWAQGKLSRDEIKDFAWLAAQRGDTAPDPKDYWKREQVDTLVDSICDAKPPGLSEGYQVDVATPEEQAVARKLVGLDEDADKANIEAFDKRLNDQVARLLVDQAAKALVEARRLAEVRGARVVRSGRDYALVEQPVAVLPDVLAAEVNLLGGPSGEGKSLVARDWAFDVIERGGTALWIPSEGMHDFAQRFVSSERWDKVADGLSVLDDAVNLKLETNWLLKEVQRADLVVFDVIYGMGMDDDNGVKDALPIINALKRISAEWKCATLAIGHSGHTTERRFRGSSAWRQLAAVEWFMGDGTLSCPKSKIANASALAKTYVVEYPEVRWTSVSEHLRQASGREEVIRRDFEEYPGSSDTDRAQRLKELLNLGERSVRRLVSDYRKRPGQG